MKTISQRYADFVVRTRFEDLGTKVVQQAKKLILDLVGVSLAGYATMEFPKIVVGYFSDMGGKARGNHPSDQEKVSGGERGLCQCLLRPCHGHG